MRDLDRVAILVAAKDAGGCNALLPVLKLLSHKGFNLIVYADGPALEIFEKESLSPQEISYEDAAEQIDSIFGDASPSLMLSGNSWGPSIENAFIEAARGAKIPSIGVLDSWLLYEEKFGDGTDPWRYLPDQLVVMDDLAKEDMVVLGAPPERLVVLGQPQFDGLAEKRDYFGPQEKRLILDQLGVKPGTTLILFLSQAMKEFYGDDPSQAGHVGYTEDVVFEQLMTAKSNLERKHGEEISLAIKLHPREEVEKFANFGVPVVKYVDPYSLMLSADLTIGMDTILIIEACLLGCPCLSYQPGLRKEDHLLTNRLGVGEFCYDPNELEDKMGCLLFDKQYLQASLQRASRFRVRRGASHRVYNFVADTIGTSSN